MSVIATAVKHLMAAGVTGDDLFRAIAEMEAEITNAPRPRSAGAIRQERYRDNQRHKASQSVTCDVSDPPYDITSTPQPNLPPEAKASVPQKPKRRPTAMVALPDDWEPVLTPAAQQIVDGWPPGWLGSKLAEFRDHASDKGRKSKDWQAAFRKWISKANEWEAQRNGNSGNGSGSGARKVDGFTAALREMQRFGESCEGAGDGAGSPRIARMG